MTEKELALLAEKAMENAYVPYSHYKVGAALLASSGRVYLGCNIENASYTPTVCAERTAVFKAVSEGERSFLMLAVAGGKDGVITGEFPPCGVCRQVLAEFCSPEFPVILLGKDGKISVFTLSQLLPGAFTPDFISND